MRCKASRYAGGVALGIGAPLLEKIEWRLHSASSVPSGTSTAVGSRYLDDAPSDLRCDGESRTRVGRFAPGEAPSQPENFCNTSALAGRTSACPLQLAKDAFGKNKCSVRDTHTVGRSLFFQAPSTPLRWPACSPSSAGASVAIGGVSSATSRRPFFSECHLHRRERPTTFSVVWTARGRRIVNGAGLAAGPHWGA